MAKFQHRAPNAKKLPDFTIRADCNEQIAAQVARRLTDKPATLRLEGWPIDRLAAGDIISFGKDPRRYRAVVHLLGWLGLEPVV